MALSIRAYAVHRGVSHTAVRKAIASGRIKTLADGRIDPADADRSWANADPAKRPLGAAPVVTPSHVKPATRPNPEPPPVSFSVADPSAFLRARIAKTAAEAGKAQIELQEMRRASVRKAEVEIAVFNRARQDREAWLNFPDRHGAAMAAELAVEPRRLMAVLERFVRVQLEEMADTPLRLP
jgi:hypothetical protein